MNLEQTIRAQWQSCEALQSLLPAQFAVMENNPYSRVPRAVIHIENLAVAARTNAGNACKKMTVHFSLIDKEYKFVSHLIDLIAEQFDGLELTISQGRSLATLKFNSSEIKPDAPYWKGDVVFDTRIIYC